MGVILRSLWVLFILLAGTALTAWLEPHLARRDIELGPAAPALSRQAIQLNQRDRWLYPAGPVIALLGLFLAAVVIPFGPSLIGADLGIGVFYFLILVDFIVLGIAIAGWGTNTYQGIEAYYRIVAQLVAYIVPLGLAYIGAVMMARSLSTVRIVAAQSSLWFIALQPLGFVLYLVAGLMQSYRAPFLEPFSQQIEHGILSVYGGWSGWLWRITLSGLLFLVAAGGAILYLGGWQGPFLPGPLWMLLKTFAIMGLMIWVGGHVRPLNVAQMLSLSWKILTPIGLLNVLIVGVLILIGVKPP
jgi:NADH-quinone oxidoreductase subunit H